MKKEKVNFIGYPNNNGFGWAFFDFPEIDFLKAKKTILSCKELSDTQLYKSVKNGSIGCRIGNTNDYSEEELHRDGDYHNYYGSLMEALKDYKD